MSSETPADRSTDTPDEPGGSRPRRALEPDETGELEPGRSRSAADGRPVPTADSEEPVSPSTPVRFHDRLAARARRAEPGWSWELPNPEDGPQAQPDDTPHPRHDGNGRAAEEWFGAAEAAAEVTTPAADTPAPETPAPETPARETPAADTPAPEIPVRETAAPEHGEGRNAWITAAQPPIEPAPAEAEAKSGRAEPSSEPKADAPAPPSPTTAAPTAPTTAAPAAEEEAPALGPDGKPLPKPTGFGTPVKPTKGPVKKAAAKPTVRKAAGRPGRQRFRLLQGMTPPPPREEIPDQSHLPANERTDLAARVTDLSVTYRTSFEKKPTLRQAVMRLGRGQRAVREIKALQGISFEVKTGSSIGIIGRNGAGKSTLMRVLSGTLPPTSGTVEVWGKASTLLALGSNFNHSLSGRENIILGGLAAGLSKDEVVERANEIADWTELGDFIDMPMRTYSSGMAARVSFAVAVHMEPDILMVDEGMSTGDAHFKDKASAKMTELQGKARAMFLVSHGLGSITELCDQAIWIDKGRLIARGEPAEVVDMYLSTLRADKRALRATDVEDV